MRNKFEGVCYYCGLKVEKGKGHFEKIRNGKINGKNWLS